MCYIQDFETKSTIDQIVVLKEIQTSCYKHKIKLHTLFIVFKHIYDWINREKMYQTLIMLGILNKLLRLINLTWKETINEVIGL